MKLKKWIGWMTCMLLWAAIAPAQEIFKAIFRSEIPRVTAILEAEPLLINARNNNGQTPLLFAVAVRNHEIAKFLLEKGSLVNCGDNHLRAPIHYANWNNDMKMIELLLEYGTVIDTRAIGGATPLIHSSLANQFAMSRFLIEKGADIHIQCNSLTTPLYFAVLNNNLEYLDYLIQAGAEIDVPDFLGRTPLRIAVRDGNREAAEKLLQHGANPFIRDAFLERSLLHLAAIAGHEEMIGFLLQKGLAINKKDKSERTPLDYAYRYGNRAAAKRLADHGARAGHSKDGSASTERGQVEAKPGAARVVKLQNGSWAVITKSSVLVLGYSEIGSAARDASLLNGHITAEIFAKNRNVFSIDPDYHPVKERYSLTGTNPLLAIPQAREQITFVFNSSNREKYGQYELKKVHFPEPGETLILDDLHLTVVPSYERNLCYLMEIEGLTMAWITGICDNYLAYKRDAALIKTLHENKVEPDILFLGSPAGIGPEIAHGIRETFLEASVLGAKAVFVFGHEALERKVFNQLKRKKADTTVFMTAANPGDSFQL